MQVFIGCLVLLGGVESRVDGTALPQLFELVSIVSLVDVIKHAHVLELEERDCRLADFINIALH